MAQLEAVTQLAANEARRGFQTLYGFLGAVKTLDGADVDGAVGKIVCHLDAHDREER